MLIYLLLGCNMGNCLETFTQAKVELQKSIGELCNESKLYLTDSWGNTNQQQFLNQAISLETNYSSMDCLKKILEIETKLGRIRNEKWQPRTIDIDILLYGDQIVEEEDLKIPHPFLHQRKFALIPLIDISNNLIHPVFKKNISNILHEIDDNELNVNPL